MRSWYDYLIAIIIIAIGSLFGPLGFILAVILVSKLSDGIDLLRANHTPSTYVEQSIEDAWRHTSQTSVPEDMYLEYRAYLKSPEWYALRKLALKRDSHRCTRCGYIGNLQVHHTNYTGIYENFDFSIDQLESICRDCHRDVHQGILSMKKDT